jgi:hypothetical protein
LLFDFGLYAPRMILAGIDEAGYGPLLGPLVVGCAAFSVEDVSEQDLTRDGWPCLWKRLKRIVSRNKTKRKLHVNDSKQVYSPGDLKALESAVLAMCLCRFGPRCADCVTAILNEVAPHVLNDLDEHPWYAGSAATNLPLSCDRTSVAISANALKVEMRTAKVGIEHLGARVILERQFNQMCEQTHNKAATLFSLAAMHIDELMKRFAGQPLAIVCDRHGGREHYGALLRLMFEDWHLQIEQESEERSDYRLVRRDGTSVRILFMMEAERQCMSTALASMIGKYLREMLMTRFNAFWQGHLPELKPTAGYYGDGTRFLKDIEAKRRELGIDDAILVRSR